MFKACLFALTFWHVAGIPPVLGYATYETAITDGMSPARLVAVLYSEHRSSEDYWPPYGESENGAVGLFQMVDTWRRWANDEYGWTVAADMFATDPYVQIRVASKLVVRIEERHQNHGEDGHPLWSHWKCSEDARAALDAGQQDAAERCLRASERLAEEVDRFEVLWEAMEAALQPVVPDV